MVPNHNIVVGIDVGGPKKGFHAVALRNGAHLENFASGDPVAVALWCQSVHANLIGIDAPSRWSPTGRAREAERQLMQRKVWCFSTPTSDAAIAHPKNQFGWMLAGEALYAALASTHVLLRKGEPVTTQCAMFETFPHAVTCSLLGQVVSARKKNEDRRRVLKDHGITAEDLSNIDLVDAAICALAAKLVADGCAYFYGDESGGYIVVPRVIDIPTGRP